MQAQFPPRKRSLLLFSLAAAAIAVLLFAVEAVLHVVFVPASALSPHSLPGVMGLTFQVDQLDYQVVYQYNRDGFRGPEFPATKPAGCKRLLVLGDSFGEGFGVSLDQRFSELLLGRLNAAGTQRWDLVNASQAVTNPDAYFDNLIRFGVAFQPDLVVIAFFLGNDFMDGRAHACPQRYTVQERLPARRSAAAGLCSLDYLRKLVRQARTQQPLLYRPHVERDFWSFLFRARIDRAFYLRTLHTSDADFTAACASIDPVFVAESLRSRINPSFLLDAAGHRLRKSGKAAQLPETTYNAADRENTYALLAESVKVLQARNIPCVIALIPDVYTAYPEHYGPYLNSLGFDTLPARLTGLADMQQEILRRFEADGIRHVDLTAALRACGKFPYYLHDQHFNPLGHALAGAELFAYLQKAGLVPAR